MPMRVGGIAHPQRDRGKRGRAPGRGQSGQRIRVCIDDQVHRTLAVQHHFARTVPRDGAEPHFLEQSAELLRLGSRVLDELDPVEPERVARRGDGLVDAHGVSPRTQY